MPSIKVAGTPKGYRGNDEESLNRLLRSLLTMISSSSQYRLRHGETGLDNTHVLNSNRKPARSLCLTFLQ